MTAVAAFAVMAFGGPGATAADVSRYNRDIRPILSENCFSCHGPDRKARKGKLRLDVRDEAVKAGRSCPATQRRASSSDGSSRAM